MKENIVPEKIKEYPGFCDAIGCARKAGQLGIQKCVITEKKMIGFVCSYVSNSTDYSYCPYIDIQGWSTTFLNYLFKGDKFKAICFIKKFIK